MPPSSSSLPIKMTNSTETSAFPSSLAAEKSLHNEADVVTSMTPMALDSFVKGRHRTGTCGRREQSENHCQAIKKRFRPNSVRKYGKHLIRHVRVHYIRCTLQWRILLTRRFLMRGQLKKKKNVFSIYKYGSEGHRDHKIFVSTENSGALLFSMKRVILYGVKSHRLPFRNREYSRRIRLLTSNVYFIIIFYKYYFISCYFGFESRPGPLIACIHAISHA